MHFDYSYWNYPASDDLYDNFSQTCQWMIFGEKDNLVDLSEMNGTGNDVFIKLPRNKAQRIMSLRYHFINELKEILNEP